MGRSSISLAYGDLRKLVLDSYSASAQLCLRHVQERDASWKRWSRDFAGFGRRSSREDLCAERAATPKHPTPSRLARRPPMSNSRPPLPPFSFETAVQKVGQAEDAWNTRDPERVALAYTEDSRWRNRAESVDFVRTPRLDFEEWRAFLRTTCGNQLDVIDPGAFTGCGCLNPLRKIDPGNQDGSS